MPGGLDFFRYRQVPFDLKAILLHFCAISAITHLLEAFQLTIKA